MCAGSQLDDRQHAQDRTPVDLINLAVLAVAAVEMNLALELHIFERTLDHVERDLTQADAILDASGQARDLVLAQLARHLLTVGELLSDPLGGFAEHLQEVGLLADALGNLPTTAGPALHHSPPGNTCVANFVSRTAL